MDINQLTLGQIREIQSLVSQSATTTPHPYRIGANVFIRTVTMNHTGRLIEVHPHELVLEDAAWIADSGLFTNALATGDFSEVEMFPKGRVIIGRGAIIDVCEINAIPSSRK